MLLEDQTDQINQKDKKDKKDKKDQVDCDIIMQEVCYEPARNSR